MSQLVCGVKEGDSLSLAKHLLYPLLGHFEETSVHTMKKEICELLLEFKPKVVGFPDRSTYIANCVFVNFLSYSAIMLNIVTIHAIRKASSLPSSLKPLLLSLAVSDVGVGLLNQPFYTSLLVKLLQKNKPDCNTFMIFKVTGCVFFLASFLGVVATSVDRFLAIHLHLRYQELVTHKRVVAVVISIWLLSVFLPLAMFWISARDISTVVMLFVVVIGLLVTTVVYIRIYVAVQRHKNQIQSQQVQEGAESGELASFASLIKSAVGVFYVYLVFLICYLPFFIFLVALAVSGPSLSLKRISLFPWTLVYLNSSLNPVIYCWKMRHIRHAIVDILRNMPWFRNRGTH